VFSPATIEAIGSYVYALADESDRIFYVGKGEGNRVFEHVEEVRNTRTGDVADGPEPAGAQDDDTNPSSLKHQKIASMLSIGIEPTKYIIREGLTPEQALLVEAVLISVLDWQLEGALTNQVAGHGTARYGLKTVEELEATRGEPFRLASLPYLKRSEEVVAINVNRRWEEVTAGHASLLEIAKGRWKISRDRAARCRFAIVHANGVVRGVFEISRWNGPDPDGRCSFEAVGNEPLSGPEFSQKNAASLFGVTGSGSQNPIRYVRLPS
jgi:hypothetical protein